MKNLLFCLFCCFQAFIAFSQTKKVRLDIARNNGILLEEGWKYQEGDNPKWANPDFDDSKWQSIDPTQDIRDIPQIKPNMTGWLRIRFRIDSTMLKEHLVLQIRQSVASELYLNGQFVPHFEQIKSNFKDQSGYDPLGFPIAVSFKDTTEQVIAVRFQVPAHISPFKYWWRIYALQHIQINRAKVTEDNKLFREVIPFRTGIMFVLFLVHLAFFYFHPSQHANLYFSLYAFAAFVVNALFRLLMTYINDVEIASFVNLPAVLCVPLSLLFLILALYRLFDKPKGIPFWMLISFILLGLLSYFIKYEWSHDWNMFWSPLVVGIEAVRVAYQALKRKKRGATIVLVGAIIYFLAAFVLFPPVGIKPSGPWFHLCYTTETLSLLIALSCYLAYEFAFTNQSLIQSLQALKQLSEEKEQTLLRKNAELEAALLEGQTTERKRVAADLHDNLSSMLTAVRWNLMGLNKNNLSERERNLYDEVLTMTTSAHDQVRLISHNLLPEELEKEGLTRALERLVNKLNRSGTIHFNLTITHLAERLSKKTEFELYSIILELTHNVIKHSGATETEISLIRQDERIRLVFSDNGKGLAENRQSGMGIQNVESRVKSLNGKWHMHSREGKGVVFEAEFS